MGSRSRRPEAPGQCQSHGCSSASLLRLAPAPVGHLPCGSSAVQGLWPDGGTVPLPHWGNKKRRSEKPHPKPNPAPQSSYRPGLTMEAWRTALESMTPAGSPWARAPGGHPPSAPPVETWTCPGSASLRGAYGIALAALALSVPRLRSGSPTPSLYAMACLSPVCGPGLPLRLSEPKEVSPLDAPR